MFVSKQYCFPVVALILSAGPVTAQDWGETPAARVEIAVAEMRDLSPVVDVSGTVISRNNSRIAAEVEGVLTWIADVGDAVNKGDVIARIDPRLMEVAFARAKSNVARLESDFLYRERQLERTQELATLNNASKTLLDEATALRDQAMHQLADARATLARAEGDLARTRIRAAFSGHISERLASLGEYVTVGTDVLRLVDTHEVEIVLPASISLTQYLESGMQLAVRNNSHVATLPIRTVVPVGDRVSRQVEVRLDANGTGWLIGTAVQVSLPSDTAVTTVAIPRDALIERGGQRSIFRVGPDNTAEQIPANVRTIVGLWVGIADGIEAGDRIIVRGAERLQPGQAVDVANAGANGS